MRLSENSLKIRKIRFGVSSDVEFIYVWNKGGHIIRIKFINKNLNGTYMLNIHMSNSDLNAPVKVKFI